MIGMCTLLVLSFYGFAETKITLDNYGKQLSIRNTLNYLKNKIIANLIEKHQPIAYCILPIEERSHSRLIINELLFKCSLPNNVILQYGNLVMVSALGVGALLNFITMSIALVVEVRSHQRLRQVKREGKSKLKNIHKSNS